ncbi:hypothetical protein BDV96DRAFT_484564 [Lophiotrema nucula]|uniref:Protein kinase domain-containing protein n=1 Tax=Lophiotrema nucula TaxID=690887 RepID=A0A6A5ZM58_9PLEO|nr:hypothetical protein BDV96DRAFT_484564 [Lophiotrema nucula]
MKCPLCEFVVETVLPEIHHHITEHVHAFALRALPWGVSGDTNFADSGANDADTDTDQNLDIESDDTQNLDLQSRIFHALVQTREPDKNFLPNGQLARLIDAISVARELTSWLSQVHTTEQIQAIADAVCMETLPEVSGFEKPQPKSYRKVFAVLVLTEMSPSITAFLENDVSDLDLPLELVRKGGVIDLRRQATTDLSASGPLQCFNGPGWSPMKRLNFERNQWALLAPVFSPGSDGSIKHYAFPDQSILPFESVTDATPDEGGPEYHGGFGKVFMVRIHKDHVKFAARSRDYAIKQLYELNSSRFQTEVNILSMFSGPNTHPHVITLLATYEQSDKAHLMFYRAEGDLFRYWKEIEPTPQLNYKNIFWIADQCAGIADGLSILHTGLAMGMTAAGEEDRQYGRHGDINPGNILWFGENLKNPTGFHGCLQISDFGQAELNSRLSRSQRRSVANTLTYRPPECDIEPKIINQYYDIWCLGCVYLEFLAWALGGEKLLSEFVTRRVSRDVVLLANSDTFFQIHKDGLEQAVAVVKPAVVEFIEVLHCHENCTNYFHEFLDVIKHEILIIDPHSRLTCKGIHNRLVAMRSRYFADQKLAEQRTPWRKEAPAPWIKTSVAPDFHSQSTESLHYSRTNSSSPGTTSLRATPGPPELPEKPLRFSDASPGLEESYQEDQSLEESILAAFETSNFDTQEQDYLPEERIQKLVTRRAIIGELKAQGPNEVIDPLVAWTLDGARKIFAIMVECGLREQQIFASLQGFRQSGFKDASLPIEDPRRRKGPAPEHFDSRTWNMAKLYNFYRNQWKYLAPVFTDSAFLYHLAPECILPFTIVGEPKVGAFSSIRKVLVHPDHLRHPSINEVAVKEIRIDRGNDRLDSHRAWEMEAKAVEAMYSLDHEHILKCFAAIERGNSGYFMFPWATGESLRDYWYTMPRQSPRPEKVKDAIHQLRGLADALATLHSHNFRHGDLKPENILRFLLPNSEVGLLKIADVGNSRRHVAETQLRRLSTRTTASTTRYEAPEVVTAREPRSRLFDVWSIGCITLELIIWLLYGSDELSRFYGQLQEDPGFADQFFEVLDGGAKVEVHHEVRRWMDHIQRNDPEFSQNSALNDLLDIVRSKLLVVSLPNRSLPFGDAEPGIKITPPVSLEGPPTRYRATAQEFVEALDNILSKIYLPGYLITGKAREVFMPPSKPSTMPLLIPPRVTPGATLDVSSINEGTVAMPSVVGYTIPSYETWEFPVDNDFAEKVLAKLGPKPFHPDNPTLPDLCDRCVSLNFWAPGFSFEDSLSRLRESSQLCHFCRMLYRLCERIERGLTEKIHIERSQSNLLLLGIDMPIMSILRSPGKFLICPIQLGFPELPRLGTITTKVMKLWLDDCNQHHTDCHLLTSDIPNPPTRLIDVGSKSAPVLRLIHTHTQAKTEGAGCEYIALSFAWGTHHPIQTRNDNLTAFVEHISEDLLPATFKDAIQVTRDLGIQYLWVDALCIVQDSPEDFYAEVQRMDDTFRGAYCVLAATSATGSQDGFLKSRSQRDYVTFQRGSGKPFYVCEAIDDFNHDVIEAHLHQHAWTLQERALARRTIYFAETQTYFECGCGIRCETLVKTHNNMADFLGDPNFPSKSMHAPRGLKVRNVQDLYWQYSRLLLTKKHDRPFAILGLETRLRKTFNTKGWFGVIGDGSDDSMFHRTLLWQRGQNQDYMTAIEFPADRRVPSWSWMAYDGGIDYLNPGFQTTDWELEEIQAPWSSMESFSPEKGLDYAEAALIAVTRDFNVGGRKPNEVKLVYDTERTGSSGQRVQCVVIARSREELTNQEKVFYVLLVMPTGETLAQGERVYERVGVGQMLGKFISLDQPGIPAKIY